VCERLATAAGETATLDVLVGDVIVPIEQATASTSVVSVNWLGGRYPVHCTASGKAIMAFASEPVRARLHGLPLDRVTPHTITDRERLAAELDEVRREGLARTHEELEVGLDAVAAPVFGPSGDVVAALDVSGPSHRVRGAARLDREIAEGAADLSRRLGYRGKRPEKATTAGRRHSLD
jgi:DNA-binding IclR family transcriptional regulator